MAPLFNELEDDEQTPYDSISSRPPLPSAGGFSGGMATPDPVVKSFLERKLSTPKSQSFDNDPLMQQYFQEQSDLNDYRQAKVGADANTNIAQSLSQLAQGVNAPTQNPVFKNIDTQNQGLLESKEKDLDRRRKVLDAIEARKAREEQGRQSREERRDYRTMAQQARQEREARPSEKQAEAVQGFDDSIAGMKSVLGKLGNNSQWTGPVDGRLPDALVGGDEIAFRRELGTIIDNYRKVITGAGASNQELKRLESRLPQPTDSFANFKAKADDFVKVMQRNRGSFLSNLKKQGKNVAAFEDMPSESASSGKIVVSNGKETLSIDPSDLADAKRDGYHPL